LSGCIELEYETRAKLSIGKKKPTLNPEIVGNGYPNSIPVKKSNILTGLSAKRKVFDEKALRIKQSRQKQQKSKLKSKSFFARFMG
jgi:hypothetical protein